jgi:hypothetical protein
MYSAIKVQTIYNDGKIENAMVIERGLNACLIYLLILGTFYMIVLANNQLSDNFTERDIC